MLTHTAIGPDAAGLFTVARPIPGTRAFTAVCSGCTADAARAEARRLNQMQLAAERGLRRDAQACGIRGTYPDLKGRG